ncbi:MAG: toll/interleukin-1 receptor domain-containing protein [Sphingobacteriales bacterium]|nr:MAG: toll/interleukin-1 receptor domain-containing protein [Sphingobacteriales bacterium]
MKAFISYSHKDEAFLDRLHTHLAQLRRDGILSTWTDEQIPAGSQLDQIISRELESAQVFIALLSPDYIASNYCYEKEFESALKRVEAGDLIIVPIILESCEWLSTPFGKFKALPKDGKAISTWQNANTAFLNITQELRKLLTSTGTPPSDLTLPNNQDTVSSSGRNYRVKKDFDSIQKMDFAKESFDELKEILTGFLKEIGQSDDQIKHRAITDTSNTFEAILVNRHKVNTECMIRIVNDDEIRVRQPMNRYDMMLGKYDIGYTLGPTNSNQAKGFQISNDDYELFWIESAQFHHPHSQEVLNAKDMANRIWDEWLEQVGITG